VLFRSCRGCCVGAVVTAAAAGTRCAAAAASRCAGGRAPKICQSPSSSPEQGTHCRPAGRTIGGHKRRETGSHAWAPSMTIHLNLCARTCKSSAMHRPQQAFCTETAPERRCPCARGSERWLRPLPAPPPPAGSVSDAGCIGCLNCLFALAWQAQSQ